MIFTLAAALLTAAPVAAQEKHNPNGGGVQVPIASRWIVDAAYRYSRIAADPTLSAAPLNTNGMTIGLGSRF